MKLDVIPPCSEPTRGSVTLYLYKPEDQGPPEVAILDASSLYDSGDMESQDSGFEYTSATEIEVKEHGTRPPNGIQGEGKRPRPPHALPSCVE